MKTVVKFMLVIFLVIPNCLAFYMWRQAQSEGGLATLVAQPGQYSASEPFVAEGTLESPSGQSLTSLHNEKTCLAFRTLVRLNHTVTNSDGELEDRHQVILENRSQVDDLQVNFGSAQASFALDDLERFFNSKFAELDGLPDYVPEENLPTQKYKNFWYDVSEAWFASGDKVTVLGQVAASGRLGAHPQAGELIVFPGDRAKCAAALESSSRLYKTIAAILVGVAIFAGLILGIILRFMRD